jgi:hypothetical protein
MSALQATHHSVPKQTALHTQTTTQFSSLVPRIVVRPYAPAKLPQRENHWQQRLNQLFAKQRY